MSTCDEKRCKNYKDGMCTNVLDCPGECMWCEHHDWEAFNAKGGISCKSTVGCPIPFDDPFDDDGDDWY